MTTRMRTIFVLVILLVCVLPASAGTLVMIVHKSNPVQDISSESLVDMYLGKRKNWPSGETVTLVEQKESNASTEYFRQMILNIDAVKKRRIWATLVFSGEGYPPYIYANDAAVIAFVSAHPNAIGYIAPESINEYVKVVTVDGKKEL